MSCWKLFIDDIRNPPDDSYTVARSVFEAQLMISFYGI
ncbi:MAG: Cyclic-phosphate processing Receiver domain [Campylobacterota bacterium]|nr:Cyclic-phosphate processing Receiver domain [Campylobacterota bacterium]